MEIIRLFFISLEKKIKTDMRIIKECKSFWNTLLSFQENYIFIWTPSYNQTGLSNWNCNPHAIEEISILKDLLID